WCSLRGIWFPLSAEQVNLALQDQSRTCPYGSCCGFFHWMFIEHQSDFLSLPVVHYRKLCQQHHPSFRPIFGIVLASFEEPHPSLPEMARLVLCIPHSDQPTHPAVSRTAPR